MKKIGVLLLLVVCSAEMSGQDKQGQVVPTEVIWISESSGEKRIEKSQDYLNKYGVDLSKAINDIFVNKKKVIGFNRNTELDSLNSKYPHLQIVIPNVEEIDIRQVYQTDLKNQEGKPALRLLIAHKKLSEMLSIGKDEILSKERELPYPNRTDSLENRIVELEKQILNQENEIFLNKLLQQVNIPTGVAIILYLVTLAVFVFLLSKSRKRQPKVLPRKIYERFRTGLSEKITGLSLPEAATRKVRIATDRISVEPGAGKFLAFLHCKEACLTAIDELEKLKNSSDGSPTKEQIDQIQQMVVQELALWQNQVNDTCTVADFYRMMLLRRVVEQPGSGNNEEQCQLAPMEIKSLLLSLQKMIEAVVNKDDLNGVSSAPTAAGSETVGLQPAGQGGMAGTNSVSSENRVFVGTLAEEGTIKYAMNVNNTTDRFDHRSLKDSGAGCLYKIYIKDEQTAEYGINDDPEAQKQALRSPALYEKYTDCTSRTDEPKRIITLEEGRLKRIENDWTIVRKVQIRLER